MMTVLLNDNNELIVTVKDRIMQRSKNVDVLSFIVPRIYKDSIDMLDYACTLEYLTPASHRYKVESLVMDESLYYPTETSQPFIKYTLPFDTNLTLESGDVEMKLTLTFLDVNEDGQQVQYVRETSSCKIPIIPITAWSDVIADEALTPLNQKILELQGLANAINELATAIDTEKADNIAITNEYLTLTSKGVEIGDKISLDDLGEGITESTTDGLIKVLI